MDASPTIPERFGKWGTAAWETSSRVAPGVGTAFAIGIVARLLSSVIPSLPDVVIALGVGVAVGNLGMSKFTTLGAKFIMRFGLRAAIIALGAGVDLRLVLARGWATLAIVAALVVIAITLGIAMGRVARLDRTVAILLGVGTAICGASAILAVSPLIRARPRDTAYAVTTIFAFNIVALLCLPWVGHQLNVSQVRFGTWIGTAVNDTSVVVATGYVYGTTAGGVATLVKLARTLLLVPLAIGIGYFVGPVEARDSVLLRARRTTPWFVLGFFGLALLNTAQVLPSGWMPRVAHLGATVLVGVLAAVGLSVDIEGLRSLGPKPLLIGVGLALTMVLVSGALIWSFQIG